MWGWIGVILFSCIGGIVCSRFGITGVVAVVGGLQS